MFGDHNIVLSDEVHDSRAIAAVVSNMRPEGEVAANARLIAASPELLLVAKRIAEWVRAVDEDGDDLTYLNSDGWADVRETADMARAAIAKAGAA